MKIFHTLTAAAFLIVAPLLALAQNEATNTNEAPHISGGIGAEGMAEITAQQKDYNLKVLFVRGPSGEYLALVNVKITDAKNNTVLETVTDGPVLLVNLKPGKYNITAITSSDAKTLSKKIIISSKHTEITFRFPKEGI